MFFFDLAHPKAPNLESVFRHFPQSKNAYMGVHSGNPLWGMCDFDVPLREHDSLGKKALD